MLSLTDIVRALKAIYSELIDIASTLQKFFPEEDDDS